jgi:hypothetical protein
MSANVRRDRDAVPALDALLRDSVDARMAALADGLAAGFSDGDTPSRAVHAAVAVAIDFWTWRRLADEGLDEDAAAALVARMVASA